MLCYVCLPEGIWFDWDNYGIRLLRIGIEWANTIRESNMAGKSLIQLRKLEAMFHYRRVRGL